VFLGEHLENILSAIENGEIVKNIDAPLIDLDLSSLPIVNKDNNDRNRTSPFAFTGNKFEFRAAGSSQSISLPATVINTIVAESLDELSDKIEKRKHDDLTKTIMDVLKEEIKEIRPVIFGGDNYSHGWQREAKKRGLPNFKTSPQALKSLNTEKAEKLFEKYKVLTGVELHSRYQIYLENYIKKSEIESRTFCSIVSSRIIPAAYKFQNEIASSIKNTQGLVDDDILMPQKDMLKRVSTLIGKMHEGLSRQQSLCDSAKSISDEQKKAEYFCSSVKAAMDELRQIVDELETIMDDSLYPLPKLWEMLFIV
jgi:glutamine synthetase